MQHRKRLYTRLNKVTLCFCFGGSHQNLKVCKVKCIPGDPAITCPVLFKGSRSPLLLAFALHSLLYVSSLSRKAVLSVLLAVLCYACGYSIVCLSSGLYGSIFIYYKRALRIYGYAYNHTWGAWKMAKTGESQTGSVSFLSCCKERPWWFWTSTFKSELFREIFFEFRLVYSQSMSDRFSAHVRPVIHVTLCRVFLICVRDIILKIQFVHSYDI